MKRKTKMTLADLKRGESRTVVSVRGEDAITRRLMEMGVVPGVSVSMVKSAPFGDPLEIRVRGYSLALRRNEAQTVEVDKGSTNE
jgi:ferrous iron transport protein A